MDLLPRIGLEHPVVQAGMGGVAGWELAAAVSAAGALGTVGMVAPHAFADALIRAREAAPGRPVAANVLVPFLRRAHIDACIQAKASLVVFHGGLGSRWFQALREARILVFVTVGTAADARSALDSGADGLVVQGIEAGGHLVGVEPVEAALDKVRAVAGDVPVFAAGGVADSADVRRLLDRGATAAVAGTRFLLTNESGAHPEYKQRVIDADRTLNTMLFGLGWPMRHRVIPNAATDRWCADDEQGPTWVRAFARLSAPVVRAMPLSAERTAVSFQRPAIPLFSPALPVRGMSSDSVDRSALYAGETVSRIHDIVSASEAVGRLIPPK